MDLILYCPKPLKMTLIILINLHFRIQTSNSKRVKAFLQQTNLNQAIPK